MGHPSQNKVETESPTGLGSVKMVHQIWSEPINVAGLAHEHHLELTLLPMARTAEACFVDRWGPHRFEPMGQMFFLPAEQTVLARSECRQQDSIVCSFDPQAVEKWFERSLDWTDCRLQGALDIGNTRIRNLLFTIGEEVRAPGFASAALVELMAGQIAIELSRYLTGIDIDTTRGGLSPWRLRLIEQRLADNSIPPSLTELGELCDLSVRHLARAFRISRGRSLGSYIADHRLGHARRMLAQGMSIKSVAFNTGFSAPSNFTAAFIRATGETPRQYQLRTGGARARATRAH